jgi:dGTPase
MQNRFYTDFDTALLQPRQGPDYRTPFQQDRDRIVYTSAFRRMQAKTQVFSVGEYDFYRNRLTHSIEVAQIGRSICHFLRAEDPLLGPDFHVDADLVEAVCLAHDLGHPPFGHAGERALHEVMAEHGGFEGNAQTLRLLTRTIFSRGGERSGLRPTRALLDGVLKYKSLLCESNAPDRHFLYDDQEEFRSFVFDGQDIPDVLTPGPALNGFRSLECQIMDWADDTAYSLNDVNDGIRARFLTRPRVEAWAEAQPLDDAGEEAVNLVLSVIDSGDVELVVSREIGAFIRACRLEECAGFLSDRTCRYRYRLAVAEPVRRRARWYGRMAVDLVFHTAPLQQLEFKGRRLLRAIFDAYRQVYLAGDARPVALLPAHWEQTVLREADPSRRARLICDYIAGMTDAFAIRTYKRMFDPDYGSILDLM